MESISFNLSRESIFKMKLLSLVTLFVLCWVNLVESGRGYIVEGNKYYISTPDEYNFYQSLEYCARHGMFLVDVRSEIEQININTVMLATMKEFNLDNLSIWTSGTNANQDSNKFIWLTSGRELSFTYWKTNNPGSGGNLFILCQTDKDFARWISSKDNVKASVICRDKLDVPVNALISLYSGTHIHKIKT